MPEEQQQLPDDNRTKPRASKFWADDGVKPDQLQAVMGSGDEIQEAFDSAAALGIPQYAWIPPRWEEVSTSLVLPDNSATAPDFKAPGEPDGSKDSTKKFVDKCKSSKRRVQQYPGEGPNSADPSDVVLWPYPFSDFSHTDASEFPNTSFEEIKTKMGDANKAFKNMARFLGPESQGMQRLGLVYECIIYRATEILDGFNKALDSKSEKGYRGARRDYIKFLQDLDDHEPQLTPGPLSPKDPKVRSGYGRTIKWTFVEPVIHQGRIKGARVVVHWNPHSSSNGVPIQH